MSSTDLKGTYADADTRLLMQAIGTEADKQYTEIDKLIGFWTADTSDENLPDIAANFGVIFFDKQISTDEKRELITLFKELHEHAGSLWALRKAVRIFYPQADVLEWNGYNATIPLWDGTHRYDGSISFTPPPQWDGNFDFDGFISWGALLDEGSFLLYTNESQKSTVDLDMILALFGRAGTRYKIIYG